VVGIKTGESLLEDEWRGGRFCWRRLGYFFGQQNASQRAKSEFFAAKLWSVSDQEERLPKILSDAILQLI
jgi:hypothetical protein